MHNAVDRHRDLRSSEWEAGGNAVSRQREIYLRRKSEGRDKHTDRSSRNEWVGGFTMQLTRTATYYLLPTTYYLLLTT